MTDVSDFIIEKIDLDKYKSPNEFFNNKYEISLYASELMSKEEFGAGLFYFSLITKNDFYDFIDPSKALKKSEETFDLAVMSSIRLRQKLREDFRNLGFFKEGEDLNFNDKKHLSLIQENSKDYYIFTSLKEKYKDIIDELRFF